MIPYEGWYWCGGAHHFIAAGNCRFHLATRIGKFRVSTVGDYYPAGGRERQPMSSLVPNAFFETMVFEVADTPGDPCGEVLDWSGECDRFFWSTVDEANRGHLRVCGKWAMRAELAEEGML